MSLGVTGWLQNQTVPMAITQNVVRLLFEISIPFCRYIHEPVILSLSPSSPLSLDKHGGQKWRSRIRSHPAQRSDRA